MNAIAQRIGKYLCDHGRHLWCQAIDAAYMRDQDGEEILLIGKFLRRERRVCARCSRQEFRDVHAGEFVPWGWRDVKTMRPAEQPGFVRTDRRDGREIAAAVVRIVLAPRL